MRRKIKIKFLILFLQHNKNEWKGEADDGAAARLQQTPRDVMYGLWQRLCWSGIRHTHTRTLCTRKVLLFFKDKVLPRWDLSASFPQVCPALNININRSMNRFFSRFYHRSPVVREWGGSGPGGWYSAGISFIMIRWTISAVLILKYNTLDQTPSV